MRKLKAITIILTVTLPLPLFAGNIAAAMYANLNCGRCGDYASYLADGLIPADIVNRLLREKPMISGITVAEMPAGAPGLSGTKNGPIDVYYISHDAPFKVYATF